MTNFRVAASSAAVALSLLVAAPVTAQDATLTWENATELSFVSTGGNASSSTLGLKASLTGTGDQNVFKIEAGGVRGETDLVTRIATGTAQTFTVNENRVSQLTAESYFLRGRYDRTFSEAYGFAGAGWDRNTFAGIQNRYSSVAGLGRSWVESESGRFKTDIGATYTIQKDVSPQAGADEGFGGLRLSVEATRTLSETTDFASALVVDENLEETEDLRADWINSLSVSMSESLALKTSLQLLYDRLPSLLSVPLQDGAGNPTGTVLVPGDTVDTILTLTLVIKL